VIDCSAISHGVVTVIRPDELQRRTVRLVGSGILPADAPHGRPTAHRAGVRRRIVADTGYEDRFRMSRHSLNDAFDPSDAVAPVPAPPVVIPAPRLPLDHAPDGAGRHTAVPQPRSAEPVTGPIPVVVAARDDAAPGTFELPAVPAEPSAAQDGPTRSARRHAAPQRHRRRAHGRTDDASRPGRGRRALAGLGGSRRTAAVLLTAAVALVALPTAGSAAVDQCRWQVAAHELLVSLDGQTDERSTQLRKALTRAGISEDLPADCAGSAAAQQAAGSSSSPSQQPSTSRQHTPRTTAPTAAAPTTKPAAPKATAAPTKTPATSAAPVPAAAGTSTTATATKGWGTPNKSDEFSSGLSQWGVYDGSGHSGNGRRTPDAVAVANGIMTMTGDSSGNTGGMTWGDGQKYGRWEARVRSTAGSYHPVMLLWPDAENWPIGGEVDWMEISDPARRVADTFLHYGAGNNQVQGNVDVDATQWHNWAVEWTPQGITTYLDGKAWWSTRNTSILPPGPMHMTIQLDNFGGNSTSTQMQVDWVKQYAP